MKKLKYLFLISYLSGSFILLNAIKLHSAGDRDNILQQSWSTYYGGSDIDYVVGMVSSTSGDVVITGVTRSLDFPVTSGAFQTANAGDTDLFIAKFNSLGQRQWCTYYGGSSSDEGRGIMIDPQGNIIVVGVTKSFNFPVSPGAQQINYAGNYDAFILKFNSAGQRVWSTFLGGSGEDRCMTVAADNSGNVLISGYTNSSNFPVGPAAFQPYNAGDYDAFIAKVNSNGQRMWSTYYGGSYADAADGITIGNSGTLVFTGYTLSTGFPVTPGGFQTFNAGCTDAFFVSFDTAGNRLWATYYGGTDYDYGYGGVSFDNNNNLFACGWTKSVNFPVTNNAFQLSNAGGYDAYLIKFDSYGNRIWASYYGGSNDDKGEGVISDNSGNIFFTGFTNSINLPIISGALQTTNAGGNDAFIVKFDGSGQRISATYYGGTSEDLCHVISTGCQGGIIVGGRTLSTNFPISNNCFQNHNAGLSDGFVSSLNGALIGINIIGENLPIDYNLYQNYPNPFNPITRIKFDIPAVGQRHAFDVHLIIYDILGREIAVLVNEQLKAGTYEVDFDGANYPSGVYFYKLTIDNEQLAVRKMVLMK